MTKKEQNIDEIMKTGTPITTTIHPPQSSVVVKRLEHLIHVHEATQKTYHAYHCDSGCGHTTIIDKYYKNKRVYCGVCGTKSTMVYQGECNVKLTNKPSLFNIKKG